MRGIVLLTMARSRSSMTAEIFRRHGVFFGWTHMMGQPGIGYNENLVLKRAVRKARGDLYGNILITGQGDPRPHIENFADWWRSVLKQEGYKGGLPWGVKADAFCHALFDDLPHVKIGIWRNPDDIVASAQRALKHRHDTDEEWRMIIAAHHDLLAELGVPMIDTDAVVSGDHSSLERAFETCGLVYDRSIADGVIRH